MCEHGHPAFVAEVSSNHSRDIDRCLAFIDRAADIGCDAVKFQLFRINELFALEILESSEEHRRRKAWELPVEFLPSLAGRCKQRKILFSCTPFYLKAVAELLPHVDFYKVASYELLWDDLLRKCAETGKPLVLSTGMATMDEIRHAVDVILTVRGQPIDIGTPTSDLCPLTLLHCVSGYPTPAEQCNLASIQTLCHEFPQPCVSVGWSDHSVIPDVILRAVNRWQASMIEFHLDLDGEGEEYGSGHCWLPDQIAPVISEIRGRRSEVGNQNTDPRLPTSDLRPSMDGTGVKEPAPAERPDRDWRADPTDGLRPLKRKRDSLRSDG